MEKRLEPILRRRREGEKGFTLIELLVVIAVLAILAAIVIFNVTGVSNKGKANACQTDIQSAQTAMDAYLNDNPNTSMASNPFGFASSPKVITSVSITSSGWSGWSALSPKYIHNVPSFSTECSSVTATLNNSATPDFSQGVNISGS